MESESNKFLSPPQRHTNKKLIKILKGLNIDQSVIDQQNLEDPIVYKNAVKLIMKEGLKTIVTSTKGNISSMSRDHSLTNRNLPSIENTFSNIKSLSKLPIMKKYREDSNRKDQSLLMKSLNSLPPLSDSLSPAGPTILTPLQKIENSVVRAGFKSHVGAINGKQKMHNQDSILIKANLQNIKGQYLFALADGHGPEGHNISEFIKNKFVASVEMIFPSDSNPGKIEQTLNKAAENLINDLIETKHDILFSGCTMVSIIITGNNLICSNIGNCKAIIGCYKSRWDFVPLSVDHTLENQEEFKRMIDKGARIENIQDERFIEEFYVKRAYIGKQTTPGLDITRSIGDRYGKFIGILNTPEIGSYVLKPEDKFIILGSSGFWKLMSNIEAVNLVSVCWETNNIYKACETLYLEAGQKWKEMCRDREDISVIVVFLSVTNAI